MRARSAANASCPAATVPVSTCIDVPRMTARTAYFRGLRPIAHDITIECDPEDHSRAPRDRRRARAFRAYGRAAARVLSTGRREHDAGGLRCGLRDVIRNNRGRRAIA